MRWALGQGIRKGQPWKSMWRVGECVWHSCQKMQGDAKNTRTSGPHLLVVNDTQSDSIQYLNFAKKWFIQYSIQYCFTQDSIQNIIQFKINSGDSIQNIIQFNSQGMINTGRIGKVPKNWPKSVQNRQKRGLFIKNGKYRFKNWVIHSFHDKIQFQRLFNIIFFRNIQFKKLFNNLFSKKIQFKNWFKNHNLAFFNSIKYSFN